MKAVETALPSEAALPTERLLSAQEQSQLNALALAFPRVMVVRAKAAVLLKARG